MPEFPLDIELDRVEVDFHGGHVAVGKGRLILASPSGPMLHLHEGQLNCEPDEFTTVMGLGVEPGPAGALGVAPDLRFRGEWKGLHFEGQVVRWVGLQNGTNADGLAVRGRFAAKLVTVRPVPAHEPSKPTHVEVHYLGLPSKRFRHTIMPSTPMGAGTPVLHGDEAYYLHDANGWLRQAVTWSDVGGFVYQGPLRVRDDSFMSPTVWRFSLLLGSALSTPVDPIGFVERDEKGRLVEARWWRPWKDHQRKHFWPVLGGDGVNGQMAENVRRWIEAGLAKWDALERGHFGLELALLYMEKAPSQPRSEMRMRDLVIALERILRGRLRVAGVRLPARTSLPLIFKAFHNQVGREVFTLRQVEDFRLIRNALSHLGDLRDARDFGIDETQQFSQTEGALLTACMRALAAVLEVDVLLHDLASVDLPLVSSSSSSSSFARPPVIPVDRH